MPAAAPLLQKSRFSSVAAGWSEIANQDPFLPWKGEFEHWLGKILQFRRMEHTVFLQVTKDEMTQRMHRGFLCELISGGEILAFELAKIEAPRAEKTEQAGFVDEFLLNLRASLMAFHSMIAPEDLQAVG